jgi:hypothetical protein
MVKTGPKDIWCGGNVKEIYKEIQINDKSEYLFLQFLKPNSMTLLYLHKLKKKKSGRKKHRLLRHLKCILWRKGQSRSLTNIYCLLY